MEKEQFELYLIRHGIAAERGKEWPDDSKRPLTPEGISRLRKAARGLNALGVGFDQIVTSPLVRTRQTADIFAEELPGARAVRSHAPEHVLEHIADRRRGEHAADERHRHERPMRLHPPHHQRHQRSRDRLPPLRDKQRFAFDVAAEREL